MEPHRTEALTPQERKCLRLVRRDRSSKEIAKELGLSPSTVDNHLKSAIKKTGASTRFDAARLLAEAEGTSQSLASQPAEVAAIVVPHPEIVPDRSEPVPRWHLPFRRKGHGNELTKTERMIWIFPGLAVGIVVIVSELANFLAVLGSMAKGLR